MTGSEVASKLKAVGLIRSALAFKFYIQLSGKTQKIKSGDYKLSKSMNVGQIVDAFLKGPLDLWITIPEGLRREEIALKVADGLELVGNERLDFINSFITLSREKEGFLFPDTYLFPKTATALAVIDRLYVTFGKKVTDDVLKQAENQGLNEKELIILASIIERETKSDQERPIVAGILLKRMRANWPLQVDATLQYAVASSRCQDILAGCNWWEPISADDKKVDSAYNTYKTLGLPPAPIANPGLSSIRAAANPIETEYWFYLHDNQGQIHYAKTLKEHQENMARFISFVSL